MSKLTEIWKKHSDAIQLIASIATIISVFTVSSIAVNYINRSVENVNQSINAINSIGNSIIYNYSSPEEKNIYERLNEAEDLFLAQEYGASKKIYQELLEENPIAKLNLGYLYAHGLDVEQDTEKASKYYREAYEAGNYLGLQNYVSINLTAPISYEATLEALKYGYEHGNQTAISYLSICYYGELRDTSDTEIKEMASEFLKLDFYSQVEKLSELKKHLGSEIVFYEKGEQPHNTEFVLYESCEISGVKKIISEYISMELDTGEKIIVPVYSSEGKDSYRKIMYFFHMSEYFEKDKFNSI